MLLASNKRYSSPHHAEVLLEFAKVNELWLREARVRKFAPSDMLEGSLGLLTNARTLDCSLL